MEWEELKGQLNRAVRTEAIKALDRAIAHLQAIRAEYAAEPADPDEAVAIPLDASPFSPQEQSTPPTRKPDFWSPERTAARGQAQQERRQREKQEPKEYDPKPCMICRQDFTPTHHLQKKCESCRTAAAAQNSGPRTLEPRHCKDCGTQFTPTDGRQRTCLEHRTGYASKQAMSRIRTDDHALSKEEKEWKEYAESVHQKLVQRPDAQRMPARS